MERNDFIKVCAGSCLGLVGLSLLLQGCAPEFVQAIYAEKRITISKSDFVVQKKNKQVNKKYVLVKPEDSNFPIIIYRREENDYSALLLQCSHLGSELSVSGQILSCPAHGSEFDNRGNVIQGPAEMALKSYTVTSDNENVYIHLV